jgi:hypothetical protein
MTQVLEMIDGGSTADRTGSLGLAVCEERRAFANSSAGSNSKELRPLPERPRSIASSSMG